MERSVGRGRGRDSAGQLRLPRSRGSAGEASRGISLPATIFLCRSFADELGAVARGGGDLLAAAEADLSRRNGWIMKGSTTRRAGAGFCDFMASRLPGEQNRGFGKEPEAVGSRRWQPNPDLLY